MEANKLSFVAMVMIAVMVASALVAPSMAHEHSPPPAPAPTSDAASIPPAFVLVASVAAIFSCYF